MTLKTLKEYINLVESFECQMEPGDGFDIELDESTVIETVVTDAWDECVLIDLDEAALEMLTAANVLVTEAEYQGRTVQLNHPMPGDVKKSKVYVKKPNGKVVKVNFGDKTMRIKKSNPERRKSFRARHNCEKPGPKWKARYWSCRAW